MGVALQKTKLYFKAALIVGVIATILIVLVKNRANRVNVWFFHEFIDINVVWLMLMTAVVALISAAVLRMVIRLSKDWRRLSKSEEQSRRIRELDEQAKRLHAQAEDLQAREQRMQGSADRPSSGPDNE